MSASRTGALAGLQAVDRSRVPGGPYGARIHGAEVLEVEPPSGDETRAWGPPFAEAVAHPRTAAREMAVAIGAYRAIASPTELARTPATRRGPLALDEFGPPREGR